MVDLETSISKAKSLVFPLLAFSAVTFAVTRGIASLDLKADDKEGPAVEMTAQCEGMGVSFRNVGRERFPLLVDFRTERGIVYLGMIQEEDILNPDNFNYTVERKITPQTLVTMQVFDNQAHRILTSGSYTHQC